MLNKITMKKKIQVHGKAIATATLCNSFLSKAIGLMFTKRKKTVVFQFNSPKKVPIHTFFMFYPIDLVYIDDNLRVVELKSVKPYSFYSPKHRCVYIIEAPAGFIKKNNIRKGITLQLL